jgi:hypothetical protein
MKFNIINLKVKNIGSRNYQAERTDFNKFITLKGLFIIVFEFLFYFILSCVPANSGIPASFLKL